VRSNLHQRARSAFTLLELLVVIAVIGILLAMIVPAVQQVRASARRITCANNVRQIALSILNFESAHQELPPAVGFAPRQGDSKPRPETADRYSGFLLFFPFEGRYPGPYYDEEIESNGTTFPPYSDVETSGHPIWTDQTPSHICPSVPKNESEFGTTNYTFSIGDAAKDIYNSEFSRGAFAIHSARRLDDITDGISNTLGIAEIGGGGPRSAGRRFAVNQSARFFEVPSRAAELVNRWGNYNPSVELSQSTRGGNWANGTGGPGMINTILPPGSPSLLIDGEKDVDGFFSASLNHGNTLVAAKLDGSTFFVNKDIDVGDQTHPASSAQELADGPSHYGVWGEMGSRNGSEAIDWSSIE